MLRKSSRQQQELDARLQELRSVMQEGIQSRFMPGSQVHKQMSRKHRKEYSIAMSDINFTEIEDKESNQASGTAK